jgi:hypothetical protein
MKKVRHHRQQEVPSSEIVGMVGMWEEDEDQMDVVAEEGGREGRRKGCVAPPPRHRRNAEWARAFQMCLRAMAEGKDEGEEEEEEGEREGREGRRRGEKSEDEKEEKEREMMQGLAWGMGLLVG